MHRLSDKIENKIAGVTSTPLSLINSIYKRGVNQMTARSVSKICSVEGCGRKHSGKGYCGMHYIRLTRRGSLEITCPVLTETNQLPFWSHVAVTANPDKCWEWLQCKDRDGYGVSKLRGKKIRAHRLSFYLTNGAMPTLWILHTCDNRGCVNPRHLYEGTPSDNARDRMERNGLVTRGERNVNAKLNAEQVRRLRRLRSEGYDYTKLGILFGISKATAQHVGSMRTWRHVD